MCFIIYPVYLGQDIFVLCDIMYMLMDTIACFDRMSRPFPKKVFILFCFDQDTSPFSVEAPHKKSQEIEIVLLFLIIQNRNLDNRGNTKD